MTKYNLVNPIMVKKSGKKEVTFNGNDPESAAKKAFKIIEKRVEDKKFKMLFSLEGGGETYHFEGSKNNGKTTVKPFTVDENGDVNEDRLGLESVIKKKKNQQGGARKKKKTSRKRKTSRKKKRSRKKKYSDDDSSDYSSDDSSEDSSEVYSHVKKQLRKMNNNYVYSYPSMDIFYYDPFIYGDAIYSTYILDSYLTYPGLYLPLFPYEICCP